MPDLDHGLMPDDAESASKGSFARKAMLVVILGATAFVVLNLVLLHTGHFHTGHPNKRSEAEQMLGSMKGEARIMYSKTATPPERLSASVSDAERKGKYFFIQDRVYVAPTSAGVSASETQTHHAMLVAVPVNKEDGWCVLTFAWEGGDGTFMWLDSPPNWLRE